LPFYQEKYFDFNMKRFQQKLKEAYGIELIYSRVEAGSARSLAGGAQEDRRAAALNSNGLVQFFNLLQSRVQDLLDPMEFKPLQVTHGIVRLTYHRPK